jgi:hypothetical protein
MIVRIDQITLGIDQITLGVDQITVIIGSRRKLGERFAALAGTVGARAPLASSIDQITGDRWRLERLVPIGMRRRNACELHIQYCTTAARVLLAEYANSSKRIYRAWISRSLAYALSK